MATASQRNPVLARSTIGEIIGYLGAAVGLTAAGIALGDVSSSGVQVVFNLVTAVVLLAAGFGVGDDEDVYARMRSVFWFLSVFLIAGMLATLLGPIGGLGVRPTVVVTGLITAAYAFGLWWMSRRSLQVLALILNLLTVVIALAFPDVTRAATGPPSLTGLALVTWIFGGAVIAVGALGLLAPKTTTLVTGSVIAVLGPLFLLQTDTKGFGEALSLLTAIALLGTGAWFGQRGVSGIGIAGILVVSSAIVANHVQEQGLAIVVLVIGLLMVGAAIVLARTARQTAESTPEIATTGGEEKS
ncbi:MAG: hypothetical protein ACRDH9_01755 [Actinomycetota bacterium]